MRRRAEEFPFFDAPFLAFAHRGGAAYGPNRGHENTLQAFRTAVDLGYRYLETDVHATRDGRLVAFHDDRLDRVTDQVGAIAELTFDEVRTARVGGDRTIPTLAELLEAFPAVRFNIDCKADNAVGLLARELVEHRATDRVCVSSFSVQRLRRLRLLLPDVPTAVSSRAVVQLRFAPFLSAIPTIRELVDSPGIALQLPVTTSVLGRRVTVITPSLVAAAHRAGRQVHAWTIDDGDEINRLIDLGVDGIFTDRIDTLKDVLSDRGLWSAP
ncbi:glycerophosphodiester phosphodiesterase [Microlunatus sp. Gsoil 973]|uniref:glycerophosphodiester phosphodiesterase n=1 Tax=Microlunatus sp. Gsoil 973 TaxID=2672569 RepID=UPI0012B4633B|nr:glycerophosphodiester phosphodiesterase [Microlunatus sp. Gsoil 973]QGN32470.1 glycerophosphodiester phosphodiesterase [Microlunatus sp. Gsoil 973]